MFNVVGGLGLPPEAAERFELLNHYRRRVTAGLTTYERRLIAEYHDKHEIRLTISEGRRDREYRGGCSCGWTSQVHIDYVDFHNEKVEAHEAEWLEAVARRMM